MEKRLSRLSERITIVLTAVVLVFAVLVWFSENTTLYFVMIVLLLIWGFRVVAGESSCPYCGKWTRRSLRWSKPDAGYCSHCGKLMKFDDAE